MLTAGGSQGCETCELVSGLRERLGTTEHGAKAVLFKAKRCGLIFGKGVYVGGGGMQRFRYFATQVQCDAYVFEGVPTADERRARRLTQQLARERERRAGETPEERAARNAARAERIRANIWRKRGFDEPPPKRVGGCRDAVPADARKAAKKAYDHEKYLAKKAKTEVLKRAKAARPGLELVVRPAEIPVPVRVRARPDLTGEVDYSRARVTVAPVGVDYRYHVRPEDVRPVFGALPVGVYLEVDETADCT